MTLYVTCKDCQHQWVTKPTLIDCPKCHGRNFVVSTSARPEVK